MNAVLRQFARYAAVSVTAFGVDAGLLWTLIELDVMHYLAAASVAFCIGAGFAYALSVRLVFTHRRLESRTAEVQLFFLIGLAGLGINNVVIWLGVEFAGASAIAAKFVASGISLVVNFALRRSILFTPRRAPSVAPSTHKGNACLESH